MAKANKLRLSSDKRDHYVNNVRTPVGIAAFVKIREPELFRKKMRYSMTVLFDADTDMSKIKEALIECAEKATGVSGLKLSDFTHPVKKGDDKPEYEGFAGRLYIHTTAGEEMQPKTYGRGKPLPVSDPKEIYSGCNVRLILSAKAYEDDDHPRGIGVTFFMEAIQFVGHGERMGGGATDVSGFEDEEGLEEYDDGDDFGAEPELPEEGGDSGDDDDDFM